MKADLSVNCVFLSTKIKYKLPITPIEINKFAKIKLKSKSK